MKQFPRDACQTVLHRGPVGFVELGNQGGRELPPERMESRVVSLPLARQRELGRAPIVGILAPLHQPAPCQRGRGAAHLGGIDARLATMLAEVWLDASALRRYPHEFSGGQRQRINIARALALRPELLVLDEPVSALDVSVGAQIINLLRELQQHGLTCLFISHSMPLVRYLCQRVMVLQRGRLVESGSWEQVCESPREAYTQQLLAATPELPTAG